MTDTLHLVDASIYVFRAYFSLPVSITDQQDNVVNAVHGYTGFLLDLLAHQPQFVACAFDESLNTCFRNALYPAYKANRETPDENLLYQFQQCQRVTELLGLRGYAMAEYEADDIIGSLAVAWRKMAPIAGNVVILSRDKDLGQLLQADDELWDFAANLRAGPAAVLAKFGVSVAQLADYLALAGDSVDNIPGAPGIGAKTAALLLQQYESLTALLARTDEVALSTLRGAKKIAQTLKDNQQQLTLYRQLTEIKCDIPMAVQRDDLRPWQADHKALAAFADDMRFGQRLRTRLLVQAS
ncbi:MAG: DNA polymerase-1 [Candidatus Azotimanducaceae bacterium]